MDEEGSVEASVILEKSTALSNEFKEFTKDAFPGARLPLLGEWRKST